MATVAYKIGYQADNNNKVIYLVNPKKENNKKKGEKSEVYPFQIEDMRKIIVYFKNNEMWLHYLMFVLSCNLARRVGDMLSLKWKNFFNPITGNFRDDILEIREDKTDKLANPHINSACKEAIQLYVAKTGVSPANNNYSNYVFIQASGNYKGHLMTASAFLKALKKAGVELGIEYNIGMHSMRKTFGMISRMLHPSDYDSMEVLQTIYNHTSTKITKAYIGLTKKKIDAYYDDLGCFFDDYIIGDKKYKEVSEKPIISLDANDLRNIVKAAYQAGMNSANNDDAIIHVENINRIMGMVERLAK